MQKMSFTNNLRKHAKQVEGTILLPECAIDERVMEAAKYILKHNLSRIAVIGKKKNFPAELRDNKDCKFFDISTYKKLDEMASALYELRKHKGLTKENAKALVQTPQYFSMMLLKIGEVDGMVAGAVWTTADTLRPALQVIKTKPESELVSGAMLMLKEGKKPLLFTDVSLNIDPTSEQLKSIAVDGAKFYHRLTNNKPYVAMLSFSTLGSASSPSTEKVRKATELVKASTTISCVGEIQLDAAIDKSTALKKGVPSDLAGKSNVLVFPNLDAGNIGYKLASRLGGYSAIGPIMLGLNKPVNDLSRGCTTKEIINNILITKLQIKK